MPAPHAPSLPPHSTVAGSSEDALLACIDRHFPRAHDRLLLGRGDDCALLAPTGPLCLSADMFLEGVHFRRSYFSAREAGHKALAVNVSDIAAMGARPTGFALCLGLPGDTPLDWVDGFCAGMAALARAHDLPLVGGDLSAADTVQASVSVWGEQATPDPQGAHFLRRGQASPGDVIFCVGAIGLARVGLRLLEKARTADAVAEVRALWPAACAAHLTPQPQVAAGLALARLRTLHAAPMGLMDVSDGLARDLPRLLGAGPRGADITLTSDALPDILPDELRRHAAAHGLDPLREALAGGEDYALAGTCPPTLWEDVRRTVPGAWCLGRVTGVPGLTLLGAPLEIQGFDHFITG